MCSSSSPRKAVLVSFSLSRCFSAVWENGSRVIKMDIKVTLIPRCPGLLKILLKAVEKKSFIYKSLLTEIKTGNGSLPWEVCSQVSSGKSLT